MTNIEQLNKLIKSRRSIFPAMYTGDEIPKDKIEAILNNANWAPNHRKTEPWRFKVYSGEGKNRLGRYLADAYKNGIEDSKFNQMKYDKTIKKALISSHMIALCVKRDEKKSIPEWEELAALSCAVQNMYLSVTALNLGCYWSSPLTIIGARTFLQLEDDERCYGLLYLGVPIPGIELKAERREITEKVSWIIN